MFHTYTLLCVIALAVLLLRIGDHQVLTAFLCCRYVHHLTDETINNIL